MLDPIGKQIVWGAQEAVSDLQNQTDLLLRNHHDIIVLVNTLVRDIHNFLESVFNEERDVEDLKLYLSEWKAKIENHQEEMKRSSSSFDFIINSLTEVISNLEDNL